MTPAEIRVRGANEHNLASVDVDLPRGLWVAVTGPSGSGKTSLVFDTVVREAERRFLGGLSSRARHFYGKLGRGDVETITGLPAAISVGQTSVTPHARSTVGTLTGSLDLLRLLFARAATSPDGARLHRSHFSFNHPAGRCPQCQGIGIEDRVDPDKIVADGTRSIRDGALVPTLKNGYTVYSQVTLEVMDRICQTHGFDVDTPWYSLTDAQRDVILHGTKALKVPFGKHGIESRMKWEGITARPREEGYYRGLVPVIAETLQRNRNDNILRFVSSAPCSSCHGTRLGPTGRDARFGDVTLPELLAVPVRDLRARLTTLPEHPVRSHVHPPLEARITRLERLALGHLTLDRISTTLSAGEAQRVRLSAQLGAGLSRALFALDEPTLGLHPEGQAGMRSILEDLLELGNSVLVVEHDSDMVRHADHVISLGPGAGVRGGRIVSSDVDSDRNPDPLGPPPSPKRAPREGTGEIELTGASLHNLRNASLRLRRGALNVVIGPSGAGKSSLVFGTLLPALSATSGGPFASVTIDGAAGDSSTNTSQAVDARPIGRNPRSTPATWCGVFDLIRKRFAALPLARDRKLKAGDFSFNNKSGRCPECEGLGAQRIGLHWFEDFEQRCASCEGRRYRADILTIEDRGHSIASVLGMTLEDAADHFEGDDEIARLCRAMVTLGLGHLTLGQPSTTLSRGESQRVKLGTLLGSKRVAPTLIALDEPDRGLAPADVLVLVRALDELVDAGHTVVAISHHRHLWAAADQLVEVRDGATDHTPVIDWERQSTRSAPRRPADRDPSIELRGVRTHNLKGVDVTLPHDALTVVCGVSGSGKSSLVFSTLVAEAQARFAESLPFQVRRHLRRLPAPELDSADGLTPTLDLRQDGGAPSTRSTVSTQSTCGPLLRLMFARGGELEGRPCGLTASHFSRDRAVGACEICSGRATVRACDPDRLVSDPDRSLAEGAMHGTRPGRFFTEDDGQYMAILATAVDRPLDDLLAVRWNDLDESTRRIALHGTGDTVHQVRWEFSSDAEGPGHHEFETTWDGLCRLVEREADNRARSRKAAEWAAPLVDRPCQACGGSGLRDEPRRTTLGGHTLLEIESMPLSELSPELPTLIANAPALATLADELAQRLEELIALGLGHLTLARTTPTLSRGERQRVRLATTLRSGLSGITLVLDEPTTGLHERDVQTLMTRLREFRAEGNTVVLVSHRASVFRAADHVLELGPGAGRDGGRVVGRGTPDEILRGNSPTARALTAPVPARPGTSLDSSAIHLRACHAHNLRDLDVSLPASGLVCITGVSGSGKSTLAFEVLGPSIQQRRAVGCRAIEVPAGFDRFAIVHDARRTARGQTALATFELTGDLATLFEHPDLPRRAFRLGDRAGRCPACQGTGTEHVAMDLLADLDLPCETCDGARFRPEVLAATWRARSIADWLDAPSGELLAELRSDASRKRPVQKLIAALDALDRVALSHLPLGRRRTELSGGENTRVDLAANLLHATSPGLYLFDEPSTGLHEQDVQRILAAFRALAERGDLVVATEHRLSCIAAADWVVDLGPEGGSHGGRLVAQGPPSGLTEGATAAALREAARA